MELLLLLVRWENWLPENWLVLIRLSELLILRLLNILRLNILTWVILNNILRLNSVSIHWLLNSKLRLYILSTRSDHHRLLILLRIQFHIKKLSKPPSFISVVSCENTGWVHTDKLKRETEHEHISHVFPGFFSILVDP